MTPISRRAAVVAIAAALALGSASCGDDGDSTGESGTTTTIDSPTRPSDPGSGTGSTGSTDPGATTGPSVPVDGTQPPVTTPNDSPLKQLLTDPSEVGEGFVPDGTLGDGSFDTDLCEEVSLDVTWTDEASQALRRGTGDSAIYLSEAIMSFADDEAAEDFVERVVTGIQRCLPEADVRPRPDLADEAVVVSADGGHQTNHTALVRSGEKVAVLAVAVHEDQTSPLSDELLEAVGTRLA